MKANSQKGATPMRMVEELWTKDEVAAYLKMSPSWVYKAAETGRLPCKRFGSRVRFDPAVIKKLAGE